MGTGGSFPGVERGRGVMLTTHPLLVPRLRKSMSYTASHPIAPLWSVTGPLYLFFYCRFRNGTIITNDQVPSNITGMAYFKWISLHLRGERRKTTRLLSRVSVTLQIIKPGTSRLGNSADHCRYNYRYIFNLGAVRLVALSHVKLKLFSRPSFLVWSFCCRREQKSWSRNWQGECACSFLNTVYTNSFSIFIAFHATL
jgi:hypothetical protein